MLKIYIDGSARPNPGKGGIGIVISGDKWRYSISEAIPEKRVSNNEAEYCALNIALNEMIKNDTCREEITIFSDSELLVLQMTGERHVDKGGSYVKEYIKAKMLCEYFPNIKFQYIPREENVEANLLASEGVRKNGKNSN